MVRDSFLQFEMRRRVEGEKRRRSLMRLWRRLGLATESGSRSSTGDQYVPNPCGRLGRDVFPNQEIEFAGLLTRGNSRAIVELEWSSLVLN